MKASPIGFIFRKAILLEFSHRPDTPTTIFVTLSEHVETGESKMKITARTRILNRHKLLISLLIGAGISEPEHSRLQIQSKLGAILARGSQDAALPWGSLLKRLPKANTQSPASLTNAPTTPGQRQRLPLRHDCVSHRQRRHHEARVRGASPMGTLPQPGPAAAPRTWHLLTSLR